LIPPTELERSVYTPINIHAAILPFYRGIHGGIWAQINGEEFLGSTCHVIDSGIDSGPILTVEKFKNSVDISRKDLLRKISTCSYRALLNGFEMVQSGCGGVEQDLQKSKTWPRRKPADSKFIPSEMERLEFRSFFRALDRHGLRPFFEKDSRGYVVEKYAMADRDNQGAYEGILFRDGELYLKYENT
jgi:methionyl-tRNA formyltransferase